MTNHNAYYMKQIGSTANWVNIETFLSNTFSVSEITGIGDFGGSKNILFEEFNDSNEINVLAPTEDVAYEPTDVSIKLLSEGLSNSKPTMLAQTFSKYVSKGILFKDTYRQLGNILYLQDTTINSAQIKLVANSASTSEYCLLNLKFKKKYAIDIPIANSFALGYIEPDTTEAEVIFQTKISNNATGFIENGLYYKVKTNPTWIKVVVNTSLDLNIEKVLTGLTASTTYQVKAYWKNVLEETVSAISEFTTLA